MKIIVCMKQVPAGTNVEIDPETGAMKRLSGGIPAPIPMISSPWRRPCASGKPWAAPSRC